MNPKYDGIDHINVYSKGKTQLGRWLTNFAHTPFYHIYHGQFQSVEGYWYWLSTNDDKLRELHGWQAKKYGKSVRGKDWPEDVNFQNHIKVALYCKIVQNEKIKQEFFKNDLPLDHYYVYGDRVVSVPEGRWILETLESIKGIL